jgi:uncharacterized protein YdeI (BOF family)
MRKEIDMSENTEGTSKPWFKKKRIWALAIVGIFIIASAASQGGDSTTSSSEMATEESTESPSESMSETAGQKNAVRSAENYIDTAPFSKTGLIKQLEFEEYSTEDATYAVNAITVDWNEQAARSAKNYLDISAFSRSGLIKQLEFEGYTTEEATFGVDQAGL